MGQTWTGFRGAQRRRLSEHLDQSQRSNIILIASDQGAIITVNGGESWARGTTSHRADVCVAADNALLIASAEPAESGSACVWSHGGDGDYLKVAPSCQKNTDVAPDPLDPESSGGG